VRWVTNYHPVWSKSIFPARHQHIPHHFPCFACSMLHSFGIPLPWHEDVVWLLSCKFESSHLHKQHLLIIPRNKIVRSIKFNHQHKTIIFKLRSQPTTDEMMLTQTHIRRDTTGWVKNMQTLDLQTYNITMHHGVWSSLRSPLLWKELLQAA